MIQKILVLTIYILWVFYVRSQAAQKEEPTVSIGQTIKGQLYKADQYRGYHLVNINSIDRNYLFFSLKTQEVYQGFNLTLTIYKQGAVDPIVTCMQEQIDSCYILKQKLELHQNLFLQVGSDGEEIEYKITSYWSNIQNIAVDNEIRFVFKENELKQLYRLALKNSDFKELRIVVKPETRRQPFDKIKIYGSFGNQSTPSASNYDFKSFPLWEDAEGIFLYRKEIKQLTMNLIIYGSTKAAYTIHCELFNKTHRDLVINSKIDEYLQKDEKYSYHITFKDQKGGYPFESYALRFAIFSGDLDVKFYKDQQKLYEVEGLVLYAYMGDMQYIFNNITYLQQTLPNGLFIHTESANRISTFMLEFLGRRKQTALQLHQQIYEMLSVEKTELAYFNFGGFNNAKEQNARFRITFTEVCISGKANVQFRYCKVSLNDCVGSKLAQNTDKILSEVRQMGTKTTYTLQLSDSMFKSLNTVEKNVIIIVVIQNKQSSPSFSAIEYNIASRTQFLREAKPIQAYVRKGQSKIYKYVVRDPETEKVRIHVNAISGSFETFAFRREQNGDQITGTIGKALTPVLQFTDRLTEDPIVLVIKGLDSAIYSIVVQTYQKEEPGLSYITLSEDVEFKIKITPNQFEVFEIVPISKSLYFSYKATGSLHVCLLNGQMVCSEQPGTSLQNQGEIKIDVLKERKSYIKVRNPLSRIVQVKSIFHSKKDEHCEYIKIGELVREVLTEGKCIYTVIDTLNDVQFMLVHEEYSQFDYHTSICKQEITLFKKDSEQSRFVITKSQIEQSCKGSDQYTFSFRVVGELSTGVKEAARKAQAIHVKYLIQYPNSVVLIPDGLGYHTSQISVTPERPLKKYAYSLINFVNTSIVLATDAWMAFLVKVIQHSDRSTTTMNYNDDYHYTSYHQFRVKHRESIHLQIPATQFDKYKCKQCELLIFVYTQQPVNQIVDFTLQVTQNFVVLEDGVQSQHYLNKDSHDFFSYQIKKEGKILVEISDNNQDCTQLYVSQTEYPDQYNFQNKSLDGETIYEYKSQKKVNLYITVKARENCDYSIGASVLRGTINIKKLLRANPNPLKIKKGQVRYFTLRHMTDKAFKIYSLHKYGSVKFYLNQTTRSEVDRMLKQDKIDYQKFVIQSEINDILLLSASSKYFCKGCFYILAVEGLRPTESTIMLIHDQLRVPMSQDKFWTDYLPQIGSYSKGQFFLYRQSGKVQINVHSGGLTLQGRHNNQSFSTTFSKKGQTKQYYEFELPLGGRKKFGQEKAEIIATAVLPNTIYTLRIYPDNYEPKDNQLEDILITPNNLDLFKTDSVRPITYKGYLKSKEDKLFVSANPYKNRPYLQQLNVNGTLDGNPAELHLQIVRNVLSITFVDAQKLTFQRGVFYQVSFSLDKDQQIGFSIVQSDQTSQLPENVEVLAAGGLKKYVIYPEGQQFIFDVFQCTGNLKMNFQRNPYAYQPQPMPDQPHAAKVDLNTSFFPFICDAQLTLIRWFPVIEFQDKGMGYYRYKAGKWRYDSLFKKLDFIIDPVSKATQRRIQTQVTQVRYNLYISNSQQNLTYASQCEKYFPDSVLQFSDVHKQSSILEAVPFSFSIQKSTLIQSYKTAENLFAILVADLTLFVPSDKSQQHYRFIYDQQQIPKEIFTPKTLENFQFTTLIIFVVLFIFALLLTAVLCKKFFVPMLGRLRTRTLVQQGELQSSKDKDIELKRHNGEPIPSSERQAVIVDKPLITEDKFK